MKDCSLCCRGWQPGSRAWTISQGFSAGMSLLPLVLLPLSTTQTATTKEKNATHGFPRGGLVILHLALPGRGVWRRTAFFPQKPNISLLYGPDSLIQTTMSIHVPGQLGEGFFGSTTAFVASDLFYICQKKMKSGISRFLDMLAVNLQK